MSTDRLNLTLVDLRAANVERQREWDKAGGIDLIYRGNELAGEVGEACDSEYQHLEPVNPVEFRQLEDQLTDTKHELQDAKYELRRVERELEELRKGSA